jgi:hypothetical protein
MKRFFLDRRRVYLTIFLGLALVVTLPLFSERGFVLLLDWTPVPKAPFPQEFNNPSFLYDLFFWFFNLLLPGGLLQKIFITSALFFAGSGIYFFLTRLRIVQQPEWAAYFAGILYMFNPYVYSRVLVGQWLLIMALGLLPWFFYALMRFLQNPTLRQAFFVALSWSGVVILSIHLGFILAIPIVLLSIITSVNFFLENHGNLFKFMTGLFFIVVVFISLNFYWLIPIARGNSSLSIFVEQTLNDTHIFSFSTRTDVRQGILWNTAAMYGFWGDDDYRYASEKIIVPHWFYLFCVILALVVWGVIISILKCYHRKKSTKPTDFFRWRIILPFIFTGLIVFFFAVGVSYTPFQPVVLWFYHSIPFFKGLREPQKFVALLIFVYSIFGAIGVDHLLASIERIPHKKIAILKLFAPAFFLLIPLAYSPGMFWAFNGGIKSSQYPASWFTADQFLQNDRTDFRVLFLPWHQYINLSFARGVVYNPADQFFHKPTIAAAT